MILYLIRHGQTYFNKEHIIQGEEFDESLNIEGIKQMKEIVPNLPRDLEVIFSSPLKRVVSSAEIVSELIGKEIIIREELKEKKFGSLVGKKWQDIPNGEELKERNRKQTYDYRPYGGESVEDVENRIRKFLDYLQTLNYKKALVVTSKGIIRLMYKIYSKQKSTEVTNASVHIFEI